MTKVLPDTWLLVGRQCRRQSPTHQIDSRQRNDGNVKMSPNKDMNEHGQDNVDDNEISSDSDSDAAPDGRHPRVKDRTRRA